MAHTAHASAHAHDTHAHAHAHAHAHGGGDDHGHGHGHGHGHVIMPLITLRAVLAVLLFFTFLTVGVAWVEKWVMTTFDVSIPWWVNVSVVLVIATIKSILVCMYFMQLKFDNPINSIVFGFCLFALALFMGFTIIDLHSRDFIYDHKKGEVISGGTGQGTKESSPIAVTARQRAIQNRFGGDVAAFDQALADYKAKHSHGHGHGDDHAGSSAERSRPRAGLTPGLLDGNGAPAGGGDHGGAPGAGGHGGH